MNDWPGWAKLVAGLGFPIAVAVWLMVYVTPLMDRTAAAMTQHTIDAQIQTALLRQICRNGSKTELQTQFCDIGLPSWQRP
jgi:mannose/fructose/N-acetylgalactosamine-specific phosphotransferase system component IIC